MLIKYNVMAVAGAAIGMLNTILIWKLFGVTQSADIWLLVLAVANILALLVLMGVEQYLVFYTSVLTQSPDEAGAFASTSVIWALLSGLLFALLCFGAADLLISLFAGGLNIEAKRDSASILALLLPQVAVAPLLHVTRCTLNVHSKYGRSYALSLIIPAALLFMLLFFVAAGGGTIRELGWTVAVTAGFQLVVCLAIVYPWCGSLHKPITKDFWALVKNSVTMRIGHSFHNFFVGLIINSTLSHQALGVISIFQYAKRFADGVTSVTVGPQNNIYHARQALAWAGRDRSQFRENIKAYLRITTPLFLVVSLIVLLTMPWLLKLLNRDGMGHAIDALKVTFSVLVVWQGIIAIETIFAGVVVTARQSLILWGVNGLFVGSFYFYTSRIPTDTPVWYLAVAAVLAQLVSILCFGCGALLLVKRQFHNKVDG